MSNMGGGNWVKELDSVSLTPESALSVENKIEKFKLKITNIEGIQVFSA